MTAINSATSAAANTATTSTSKNTTPTEKIDSFSKDYNMFLNLMMTQLKQQDPTQPLDANQFVSQLATFTSVEQAVKTTEGVQSLNTTMGDVKTLLTSIAKKVGAQTGSGSTVDTTA